MFDKLFESIDGIIEKTSGVYEKGIFFYVILVGFFLLLFTIIVLLVFFFKAQTEQAVEPPPEYKIVVEQATGFCMERGFNAWGWKNESEHTFYCYNREENTTIDDLFTD